MERGATHNFNTRPGEGFQQESAQAYKGTNGKNTEPQVGILYASIPFKSRLTWTADRW